MRDNVTIGEGQRGNSACIVLQGEAISRSGNRHFAVSQNAYCYWIRGVSQLDIVATIFKDTNEGEQLAKLLGAGDEMTWPIHDWLCELLLPKVPAEVLLSRVGKVAEAAYERGRKDQLLEIQRVLGLST
jgi:hypothetical protein